LVDLSEHGADVDACLLYPLFERRRRPTDQERLGIVLDLGGLGAAEADRQAGQER
jgi:hypothetical protein